LLIAAPLPRSGCTPEHDDADVATAASGHRPPCPCCGGRVIIFETFERGGAPRAPPSPERVSRIDSLGLYETNLNGPVPIGCWRISCGGTAWSPGEFGRPRCWYRDVSDADKAAEASWLRLAGLDHMLRPARPRLGWWAVLGR